MNSQYEYAWSISDDHFIRGNIPMTKEEIRSIALGKLRIQKHHIVVDIGAGTGSVSIEAGFRAKNGNVYAIERKKEGIELIKKNIERFNIKNITVIEGTAPRAFDGVGDFVDRIFIGGSGGRLEDIITKSHKLLVNHGRMVMNFITIENLHTALDVLRGLNYNDIDVVHVNISKNKKIDASLTMMQAENPIYIVSTEKVE
ncbi:MAG: precorrin-6Y C5,15-methyltransferase (decarboxylating) subunit CbiT [Clostridia bacterium]|nr:precorrin-6Y C5,15-methyltransferase (decarboxylating) subunit CbiT [Clostridia bacterium]